MPCRFGLRLSATQLQSHQYAHACTVVVNTLQNDELIPVDPRSCTMHTKDHRRIETLALTVVFTDPPLYFLRKPTDECFLASPKPRNGNSRARFGIAVSKAIQWKNALVFAHNSPLAVNALQNDCCTFVVSKRRREIPMQSYVACRLLKCDRAR